MLPCEWVEQTKPNRESNREKQDEQRRVSAVGGTDDHQLCAGLGVLGVQTAKAADQDLHVKLSK